MFNLFVSLLFAGAVKDKLKWADGKIIKTTIEKQVKILYSYPK